MPRKRVLSPVPALEEASVAQFLEEHGAKVAHHTASILSHVVAQGPGARLRDVVGVPASIYSALEERFTPCSSSVSHDSNSSDGVTTKLLIQLQDGLTVEAVIMRHDPSNGKYWGGPRRGAARATLCISSQVGCQMGCTFCATGAMGLKGDLTAAEILEQVLHAQAFLAVHAQSSPPSPDFLTPPESPRACEPQPRDDWAEDAGTECRSESGSSASSEVPGDWAGASGCQASRAKEVASIRNIVFMGMGEPLNNYAAVRAAVGTLVAPHGFRLSPNHITVSTVGIVPRMLSFHADMPAQVNLALSLHAPTQEMRQAIVPAARAYPLPSLMAALDRYQQQSGKAVFVEYVLLEEVNDSLDTAHELGALLSGKDVVVNLIPYNPVSSGVQYRSTRQEWARQFQGILRGTYGLRTTVRKEMGQDISGACGQLATDVIVTGRKVPGEEGGLGGGDRGPSVVDIEDLGKSGRRGTSSAAAS